MNFDGLQESLREVIDERESRPNVLGEYHPSQISGCPLKVFLNWMTDNETVLNCWLFQGSAVHFYLQQEEGDESGWSRMDEALRRAGYHPVDTEYEVSGEFEVNGEVSIVGSADILSRYHDPDNGEEDGWGVFDIKYSSIPPSSGHARLYKYFSQANIYAHMLGADHYGLIMINSKSRDLLDDIVVMEGSVSEKNWGIVQKKALNIHDALTRFNYGDGERWTESELMEKDNEFWKKVGESFNKSNIPSYEGECKYCTHSEYCPQKQGKWGGLDSVIQGT